MAMKVKVKDLDAKALDDQEYEEREDFDTYDGPNPKRGTILRGRIKKIWYTLSASAGNSMLVIIWEAEGNKGEKKIFNGLAIWDRIVFTPQTAFRYQPFLKQFGIKVADVVSRMKGDEEESMGVPVTQIGKWVIDSDKSLCRVTTKMGKATAEYPSRVEVSKYMPATDDAADPAGEFAGDEDTDDNDGETSGKKAKKDKDGKKGKKKDDPF